LLKPLENSAKAPGLNCANKINARCLYFSEL
jgi:hypothetical protein